MKPPAKTVIALSSFALIGAAVLAVTTLVEEEADGEQAGAVTALPEERRPAGPLPASRPSPAPKQAVPPEPEPGERIEKVTQEIEEPDGLAMCAFYAALDGLRRKTRKRPVVVSFYGDSILTSDHLTGQTRGLLQSRFGDGGHGFMLLGKPWRWYRHEGMRHGAFGKWQTRPLTSDPVPDGMHGLGGVAFEMAGMGRGRAWVAPDTDADPVVRIGRFDVSYQVRPRGGSFHLLVDGQVVDRVSTDADTPRAAHLIREMPPAPARIQVETQGDGPVRIYGVVLESGEPGVVLDSLAINGARASVMMRYDLDHWRDELGHRAPDLLVLMMGANEGANQWLVLDEYRRQLSGVLSFLQDALPQSSHMVVGPLDQASRKADGTLASKKMPRLLSEAQREVALAEGFAFFDTWSAMGGEGSMGRWVQRGLGGADFIHPTEHGARRIGGWIGEALLFGYQEHRSRCRPAVPSASGPDAGD